MIENYYEPDPNIYDPDERVFLMALFPNTYSFNEKEGGGVATPLKHISPPDFEIGIGFKIGFFIGLGLLIDTTYISGFIHRKRFFI